MTWMNNAVKRMLKRFAVYILCFKGGRVKERNLLLSDFDIDLGDQSPGFFTMIIKEKDVFYACISDRKKERHRHRVENPFPDGLVTEDIMDVEQHVRVVCTIKAAFDLFLYEDFQPCQHRHPVCFCGLRGLTRGSLHICPICQQGVTEIRVHLFRAHKLRSYPTVAEIPRSTVVPHPDPLSVLSKIDLLGHAALRRPKRKRVSSQGEESAGTLGRPPSEEKTTPREVSSPQLPGGDGMV